eukprot:CAMPEP_0119289566 /NCGR_PEP_ID=MMETSP1329-20130426/39254_1 /TAXON_ID=114041 /ORGANISM="Genus nov. species nov., Strain RCC1024" /LENGTH=87 /DNA_ID=CAMNT_0007290373 /DNA_START=144 /DNA_END=403 /DNA_ORIENTATION=-
MAAQRTKVDLSDDPMMALFETDDVAPSKSAAAPKAAAPPEEPALVSLDVGRVKLKGGSATKAKAPTTKATGDDARMGLGFDFSEFSA